jgi:SpoVK/Ycf46/Vps4 family AAA+-type ATPase
MSEPKDDPVAPFARAVLELFREDLRKVRFPDLDSESLAGAAEELNAAQLEVECIEAALASAREVVRERERLLNAQAARGISYARIYAAGNLALSARIAQIDLLAPETASVSTTAAKKRGRPRKESSGAELFASDEAREQSHEGTEEEVAA